jgi:hypothetical protein
VRLDLSLRPLQRARGEGAYARGRDPGQALAAPRSRGTASARPRRSREGASC